MEKAKNSIDIQALIASGNGIACSFPGEPCELDSWDKEAEAPDADGPEWGA